MATIKRSVNRRACAIRRIRSEGEGAGFLGGAGGGHGDRGGKGPPQSGFIVIRLGAGVRDDSGDDLRDVVGANSLKGLGEIMDGYDLHATHRLVRSVPAKQLADLEARAMRSDYPPLRSLTRYWRIDARHRAGQLEEIVARLNRLFEVEIAYAEELAVPAGPVDATDDVHAASQGYLDPAPVGIDARWAWTQPSGSGDGMGVVDVEGAWNVTHEDLTGQSPTVIHGDMTTAPAGWKDHGTAVLGEMVGVDNALGVVGIAPDVAKVRMSSIYDAGGNQNSVDALVAAASQMEVGDLMLIELQTGSFRPMETEDAAFDAIRLAAALGVIVVEAAANGGADLDAYDQPGPGGQILNRNSPDFRDSGAIMVGAALSDLPHNRKAASNYGSRVDCYAWGNNVVTCGYGDLAGAVENELYAGNFQNTSAASPIITGAALILQGMYEAAAGTRLSPGQMRALLSDPATGTAQGPGVAGAIGVMPNLRAIVEDTLGLTPDVYLRDHASDDGAVPHVGSISASPDVILRPAAVADPQASFGEGSGTEGDAALGFKAEAGQDNFIYVRMRNRGAGDAPDTTATVYWSEVSTLVTPDQWNLIGTTAPVNVPQGDTLVVAPALTWLKSEIPATGHYCFVAMLDGPRDGAPPVPPAASFDMDDFRAFVRNHNNVTWRNFNVVNELPDPASAEPASLPFLIAGAPDRPRRFDLEIIRRLPAGAELWLEIPLALMPHLRAGHLWTVKEDRKARVARLLLPAQPRVPLCDVTLAAKARHRARFMVKGPRDAAWEGGGVVIRQLFADEEVGRVTWQFQRPRKQDDCRDAGNQQQRKSGKRT